MTPERKRALSRLETLRLHVPTIVVDTLVSSFEEAEYLRPLLEVSRSIVNAKSGQQRALALESLAHLVAHLGKAGV